MLQLVQYFFEKINKFTADTRQVRYIFKLYLML